MPLDARRSSALQQAKRLPRIKAGPRSERFFFRSHVLSDIRATLALAVPLAGENLSQIAMSLIDTVMVGTLGSVPLAAVALGSGLYFTSVVICLGVLTAVAPLAAYAIGAGDKAAASRDCRQRAILAGGAVGVRNRDDDDGEPAARPDRLRPTPSREIGRFLPRGVLGCAGISRSRHAAQPVVRLEAPPRSAHARPGAVQRRTRRSIGCATRPSSACRPSA